MRSLIKKELLSLPLNAERPYFKGRLGKGITRYTTGKTRDPIFDKEIRNRQPQWFTKTADENKKSILSIRKGLDRPKDFDLNSKLRSYTSKKSSCYDDKFDNKIRKKQPHWFRDSYQAEKNKRELLDLPEGWKRPTRYNPETRKIAHALSNYTRPINSAYDEEFDKKIRKKQPQWFDTFTINSANNKEELLSFPAGCKKLSESKFPKLVSALRRYTQPKNCCYDIHFDKKIRKKQPQWFDIVVCSNEEKKKMLLAMRKGCRKPAHKKNGKLARAVRDYTNPKSRLYDAEFDKAIRNKQPQWFRLREASLL